MVAFAKLFPNPAEPFRGIFVAEQVRATSRQVNWAVVAPVPWVPKPVAAAFRKPYVRGDRSFGGIPVYHPRYPVLPRRVLYHTVAPAIARTARRSFARACADAGARLVHVHDLYPSGAAARRLCDAVGLPYVLTVHGLDLYSNLADARWRAEIQSAADGARAIVCVGSRLARDCITELGCDPRRMLVIPNTYDTARFARVEREFGPRPVRLVTLGRLSHEKGHDVLLRALAELAARRVRVTLDVVGDGPERAALEALAAELGLGTLVTFRGQLLDADVARAYAEADVFVLPSRSEGFGVALIEAMATGLPVVATRSGGPEDIVLAGDGLLVAPDDARDLAEGIATLVGNIETYDARRIAERAAERFAPDAIAERLVRLYREVLGGGPLSGALADGGAT
jgi:glycosyltransferase involved in cell wall biosynthesis